MFKYILGLDIGVQSIGWAIVRIDDEDQPIAIERFGVRCFDSGTGTESEIEQGKDESRNLKRRTARLIRRNQWRRKRRTLKLFNILRNNALLPIGNGIGDTPQQRQELINTLDKQLVNDFSFLNNRITAHLLPYKLRALALDQELPPFALGRVLLHLSQRRGFLSNKKTQNKNEDEGLIKKDISQLRLDIKEKGFRTLGEYFASLDPEEKRIRQRWTGRQMFIDEFDAIWNKQAETNQNLTKELRKKIYDTLFFQRPLKSQKNLIGKCELEPNLRRASLASVEAQQFRYWQKILDLQVQEPDGFFRDLSREEQDTLAEVLEHTEKLTFSAMRKLLGLTKPKGAYKFNLETDGVKDIRGNSTSARIGEILKERWFNVTETNISQPADHWGVLLEDKDEKETKNKKSLQKYSAAGSVPPKKESILSEEEKDTLIDEILQFEHEDALARRLEKRFQFDSNTASQLAALRLEDDYAKLSKTAIKKLLAKMINKRIRYVTAKKEIYGKEDNENNANTTPVDFLPQVLRDPNNFEIPFFKDDLRNPIVIRTLTEVRKVVNAIIRRYNKPQLIRIELARDMKKGRKEREDINRKKRDNEAKNEMARKKILEETGNKEPKSFEILKIRLAEECNWECPYTGKTITVANLLSSTPQFDIEHTLPFSRSLDNSFPNKSLCDIYENRHVKKNRTPFEAYGHDPQRWHEILTRVSKFRGGYAAIKLLRFKMETIPEDFTHRMLNDTRYISRLSGEYVGLLYGGKTDSNSDLRVQVSSGGMTAYLRDEWKLNAILADGGDKKNRNNHCHHAIDAVVIALNNMGTVQKLSKAAEQASDMGTHRLFVKDGIKPPMPDFVQKVHDAVNKINISYRVNRKVSGGFHDETNYSPPQIFTDEHGKSVEFRHIRKPLQSMSKNEINNIVDPVIRRLVQEKLERLGGDPKKFTENELPYITTKTGRIIPIRKARFRKNIGILTLAPNTVKERHVASGNNHHIEIFEVLDENGNVKKLDWKCVNLFESIQRVRAKQPVIASSNHYGDGTPTRLKFSLAKCEYVQATPPGEPMVLLRVCKISESDVSLCLHSDARQEALRKEKKPGETQNDFSKYRITSIKKLEQYKLCKVTVDLLGNIHPAND
ncbi:MAG: type II CRISPR RNA-guided endonuclease Cas9 [Planctomycetaceae bacterium]|nr:type II CRISPR RNA-guided endonuclease Cas9 [Planctomycetaceae bacterium]